MTEYEDKIERAVKRLGKLAEKAVKSEPIESPSVVAALFMPLIGAAEQEELWVLMLDTRNKVIGRHQVYLGSLNTSIVRLADVFREPIRQNANSVILVHNHPSGDPSPSPEDVAITRAAIDAGRLLDLNVLDHVIVGHGRATSLKGRGLFDG